MDKTEVRTDDGNHKPSQKNQGVHTPSAPTGSWENLRRPDQHRRLIGDYEYLTDTGGVMSRIAVIGIMLHRPAYEE